MSLDTPLSRIRRNLHRFTYRQSKEGAPPGTLTDLPEAPPTELSVLAYDRDDYLERSVDGIDEVTPLLAEGKVVWLNVDGLGDADLLARIAERFGFSRLALEDVQHVPHRAKFEAYEDRYHLILQMARWEEGLDIEQVSLLVGDGFVISFQENRHPGDCLDPIRSRIRQGRGRIRTSGADYLAYAIFDRILDAYFPVLERFAQAFHELEGEIVQRTPPRDIVTRLHTTNRQLLVLNRAAWPHRDVAQALIRNTDDLLAADTRPYLKDCLDHAIQINELTDNYHDVGAGLINFYLSLVSHRQNEVMKVLTIVATIFIPLTFIAGVYGMNFERMPELGWEWGYPAVITVMGAVAAGMLVYFVRKGWIGQEDV